MGLGAIRGCSRLMVVAHPDDETFWGGVTLATEPGWGVICLTHASTRSRRRAFKEALSTLGVPGAILDLPDRKEHAPTIEDLAEIRTKLSGPLHASHVEQVMTHGPDGEYGHPLHRALSDVVTQICLDRQRLWYFNFDPGVDVASANPAGWTRKMAAVETYLGPAAGWEPADRCHVELGRHEAPTPADDYVRPWDLVATLYSTSGMDIS